MYACSQCAGILSRLLLVLVGCSRAFGSTPVASTRTARRRSRTTPPRIGPWAMLCPTRPSPRRMAANQGMRGWRTQPPPKQRLPRPAVAIRRIAAEPAAGTSASPRRAPAATWERYFVRSSATVFNSNGQCVSSCGQCGTVGDAAAVCFSCQSGGAPVGSCAADLGHCPPVSASNVCACAPGDGGGCPSPTEVCVSVGPGDAGGCGGRGRTSIERSVSSVRQRGNAGPQLLWRQGLRSGRCRLRSMTPDGASEPVPTLDGPRPFSQREELNESVCQSPRRERTTPHSLGSGDDTRAVDERSKKIDCRGCWRWPARRWRDRPRTFAPTIRAAARSSASMPEPAARAGQPAALAQLCPGVG